MLYPWFLCNSLLKTLILIRLMNPSTWHQYPILSRPQRTERVHANLSTSSVGHKLVLQAHKINQQNHSLPLYHNAHPAALIHSSPVPSGGHNSGWRGSPLPSKSTTAKGAGLLRGRPGRHFLPSESHVEPTTESWALSGEFTSTKFDRLQIDHRDRLMNQKVSILWPDLVKHGMSCWQLFSCPCRSGFVKPGEGVGGCLSVDPEVSTVIQWWREMCLLLL